MQIMSCRMGAGIRVYVSGRSHCLIAVVFERSGMAMTTGAWTLGLVLGPAVGGRYCIACR